MSEPPTATPTSGRRTRAGQGRAASSCSSWPTEPLAANFLPPVTYGETDSIRSKRRLSTRRFHKELHTCRTLESMQVALNRKARTCGAFAEPSDGLEPSTPSLPSRPGRNWSQPTAKVWACFRQFPVQPVCDRLPLFATTGLHKGSIFCNQSRQQIRRRSPGWAPSLLERASTTAITGSAARGRPCRLMPQPF
jgi:hypothetical protein